VERVIEIKVTLPAKAGVYLIELGAEMANGGVAAAELFFYHSLAPVMNTEE
jgi:hypothetical protein